eukprot:TRINITY_DN6474_c0_g1_i1.p1 TRINITY_DN6474_c0_g1~~TRINITY_DN6474_c0_g1_i1.p1  ORF type:complete len:959 (-),score=138.63 TRINITY_DN6474_c0_g1_i1:128-3004(-)
MESRGDEGKDGTGSCSRAPFLKSDVWTDFLCDSQLAAAQYATAQVKLAEELILHLDARHQAPAPQVSTREDVRLAVAVGSGPPQAAPTASFRARELLPHDLSDEERYILCNLSVQRPLSARLARDLSLESLSEAEPRGVFEGLRGARGRRSPPGNASQGLPSDAEDLDKSLSFRNVFGGRVSPHILERLRTQEAEPEPERTGLLHELVRSRYFEIVSASVVALNTVFIWLTTNAAMKAAYQNGPRELGFLEIDPHSSLSHGLDGFFLSFYTGELLLRIYAHRFYFVVGADARWNIVDAILVFASLVGLFSAFSQGNYQSQTHTGVVTVRITRIFKLAKVLRVLRAMRHFKQLQLFVDVCLGCAESLFWAVAMIFIVLLLFAIYFVQAFSQWLGDLRPNASEEVLWTSEAVEEMFGSVEMAMLTLAQAVSGGADWNESFVICSNTGFFNGTVFFVMVTFFTVAVWNIVASMFIENTIASASYSRDDAVLAQRQAEADDAKELMHLCRMADLDKSSSISATEFEQFMESEMIREFFAIRGLDIKNAAIFYEMMQSVSGSGEVDLEGFVGACMRVKGPATSIDLHMLVFENRLMAKKQKKYIKSVFDALDLMCQRIDSINADVQAQTEKIAPSVGTLQGVLRGQRVIEEALKNSSNSAGVPPAAQVANIDNAKINGVKVVEPVAAGTGAPPESPGIARPLQEVPTPAVVAAAERPMPISPGYPPSEAPSFGFFSGAGSGRSETTYSGYDAADLQGRPARSHDPNPPPLREEDHVSPVSTAVAAGAPPLQPALQHAVQIDPHPQRPEPQPPASQPSLQAAFQSNGVEPWAAPQKAAGDRPAQQPMELMHPESRQQLEAHGTHGGPSRAVTQFPDRLRPADSASLGQRSRSTPPQRSKRDAQASSGRRLDGTHKDGERLPQSEPPSPGGAGVDAQSGGRSTGLMASFRKSLAPSTRFGSQRHA